MTVGRSQKRYCSRCDTTQNHTTADGRFGNTCGNRFRVRVRWALCLNNGGRTFYTKMCSSDADRINPTPTTHNTWRWPTANNRSTYKYRFALLSVTWWTFPVSKNTKCSVKLCYNNWVMLATDGKYYIQFLCHVVILFLPPSVYNPLSPSVPWLYSKLFLR